jgi:hypothetical protein
MTIYFAELALNPMFLLSILLFLRNHDQNQEFLTPNRSAGKTGTVLFGLFRLLGLEKKVWHIEAQMETVSSREDLSGLGVELVPT